MLVLTASAKRSIRGRRIQRPSRRLTPRSPKKSHRTEAMTGSLTRKTRVCMTPAQWDKLSADTGKAVEDMNRYQARAGPPTTKIRRPVRTSQAIRGHCEAGCLSLRLGQLPLDRIPDQTAGVGAVEGIDEADPVGRSR